MHSIENLPSAILSELDRVLTDELSDDSKLWHAGREIGSKYIGPLFSMGAERRRKLNLFGKAAEESLREAVARYLRRREMLWKVVQAPTSQIADQGRLASEVCASFYLAIEKPIPPPLDPIPWRS